MSARPVLLPARLTETEKRAIRRNLNALPEIRAEIVKRRKAKEKPAERLVGGAANQAWYKRQQEWIAFAAKREGLIFNEEGRLVRSPGTLAQLRWEALGGR